MYHALGADDHGPGDTHAEAQCQGSSHLERGLNLEDAYRGFNTANFTLDVLPNISHVDYLMLSHPTSQHRLFTQDLDDRVQVNNSTSSSGSGSSSGNGGQANSKHSSASSRGRVHGVLSGTGTYDGDFE